MVLPELPGPDGVYPSRHWQAKAEAARIINRDAGPRVEIFHGISSHSELTEHHQLTSALAQQRVAGLLLFDAERVRDWLTPARIGLPVIGVDVEAGRPMLGQLHLRLPMFLARALSAVAARGCRRPAVLISAFEHGCVPDLITDARKVGLALPYHRMQCLPTTHPAWVAHVVAGFFAVAASDAPDALIVADEGVIPAVQAALAQHGVADIFQVHMTNFPLETPVPPSVVRLGWDMVTYLQRAIALIDAWHSERRPIGHGELELIEATAIRP